MIEARGRAASRCIALKILALKDEEREHFFSSKLRKNVDSFCQNKKVLLSKSIVVKTCAGKLCYVSEELKILRPRKIRDFLLRRI